MNFTWEAVKNQCEASPHFRSPQLKMLILIAISSSARDFCHIFLNNSFSTRYLKSDDSVKINWFLRRGSGGGDTSYTPKCCFIIYLLKRGGIRDFLKLKICTFWSKRELLKFKEPRQEKLFACCFLLFLTVSLNYAHTKKKNISLFHT